MIAALHSMLDAHLDHLTGTGALVWVGVIVTISLFVGASLVAAWSVYWPRILKRLARWHAAQVRRASEAIPYEAHESLAWRAPLLFEIAFAALVIAALWRCA